MTGHMLPHLNFDMADGVFFLSDQIVQKRQQFLFRGHYELRLSSNSCGWYAMPMPMVFNIDCHVVCRRVDERRVRSRRPNKIAGVCGFF